MIRSGKKKLSVAAALLLAACGQEQQGQHRYDPMGFGGVEAQTFGLLAAACSYSDVLNPYTTDMTLTVAAGETVYVYYRPTDGKVVANAAYMGNDCITTTTRRIFINGGAGAQKVLIDYVNVPAVGTIPTLFSAGITGAPGIVIDLDNGAVAGGDIVTIRGTTLNDTWTFGQTGMPVVIGAALNADAFKDITFAGVDSLVLTTGDGVDTITGLGNMATGGVMTAHHFPLPMTVWAGAGNDVITGGAADVANTFRGEADDDLFHNVLASLSDDNVHGGDGIDTVTYATRINGVNVTLDGAANDGETGELDDIEADVENLIGGAGNDTLDATGSDIVHTLTGNAGNDTLIGAGVIDTLNGGAGDDTLRGAVGADILIGGLGSDTADYTGHAGPVTVSLVTAANGNEDVMNQTAGAATDIENLRGSANNDSLTGNEFNNIIWGGAGDDTIVGGDGDDALYGEAGVDSVSGEGGDDVVVGGAGLDMLLSGGAGRDLVDAVDGANDVSVDCGADDDIVVQDGATDTTVANCELVQ